MGQTDKAPDRIWIDAEPSKRHATGNCFDSPNPEGVSLEYIRADIWRMKRDDAPKFRRCPFCGSEPDEFEDAEIQCGNRQCPARPSTYSAETWNKREDYFPEYMSALHEIDRLQASSQNEPREPVFDVDTDKED